MKEVKFAVDQLDAEIINMINRNKSITEVRNLLNLRNKIILKYKPDPTADWTIQSKKVLSFLKKENWHVHWVYADVPINNTYTLEY
jgi:hypothetical protein